MLNPEKTSKEDLQGTYKLNKSPLTAIFCILLLCFIMAKIALSAQNLLVEDYSENEKEDRKWVHLHVENHLLKHILLPQVKINNRKISEDDKKEPLNKANETELPPEVTQILDKLNDATNALSDIAGCSYVDPKVEFNPDSSFHRIFFDCSFEHEGHSSAFLHQSLFYRDGAYVLRIEHIQAPKGQGIGAKVIAANKKILANLNSSRKNYIELEAASGGGGLVGAYAWAKLGFDFAENENTRLKKHFVSYIQRVYPQITKTEINKVIQQAELLTPYHFANFDFDFTSSSASIAQSQSSTLVSSLRKLHPFGLYHRYFKAKSKLSLGKAFLLDPLQKSSWYGVLG